MKHFFLRGSWKAAPGEAAELAEDLQHWMAETFDFSGREKTVLQGGDQRNLQIYHNWSYFKGRTCVSFLARWLPERGRAHTWLHWTITRPSVWGWLPSCGLIQELCVSSEQIPGAAKLQQQGVSVVGDQNMLPRSWAGWGSSMLMLRCCRHTVITTQAGSVESSPAESTPVAGAPQLQCGHAPPGRW